MRKKININKEWQFTKWRSKQVENVGEAETRKPSSETLFECRVFIYSGVLVALVHFMKYGIVEKVPN